MKKCIFAIAGCLLLCQLSEALKFSQYYKFQTDKKEDFSKGFDADTDLVRGIVTLQSKILKGHRHYGNIKFDPQSLKNPRTCSFNDTSDDPVTQLVILTFPSAGGSIFNASGKGSIEEIFPNFDDVLKIIAGMFKIAKKANVEKATEISDDQILSIFENVHDTVTQQEIIDRLSEKNKLEKLNRLIHLRKQILDVVNAVNDNEFKHFKYTLSQIMECAKVHDNVHDNVLVKLNDIEQQKGGTSFLEKIKQTITETSDEEELKKVFAMCKEILNILNKIQTKFQKDSFSERFKAFKQATNNAFQYQIGEIETNIGGIKNKEKNIQIALGEKELVESSDKLAPDIESTCKKIKEEKRQKLVKLGKTVFNAIKFENLDVKNKGYTTYYSGYVNSIICAYACSVINRDVEENLTKLASYLASDKTDPTPYQSAPSEIMKRYYDEYPSYIPFEAGSTPITNGSGIRYKEQRFADCVETTMRQLFATVFCSKKDENGNWLEDDLRLEMRRIPKGDLRGFFEKYSDVSEAANSGSTDIREKWAKICSGHSDKGIKYDDKRKICELEPEWKNMIQLFCLLMSGYNAEEDTESSSKEVIARKQKAAECIKMINDNGFNPKNTQEVVDTLNTLLGIRGDVEFEVTGSNLSINGKNYVVGDIKIAPKNYKDGAKEIRPDNNKMCFIVTNSYAGGHAYVDSIKKVESPITKELSKTGIELQNVPSPLKVNSVWEYYLGLSDYVRNNNELLLFLCFNLASNKEYYQGMYRLQFVYHNIFRAFKDSLVFSQTTKDNFLIFARLAMLNSMHNPKWFAHFGNEIYSLMGIKISEILDQDTIDKLFNKWKQLSKEEDIVGLSFILDHYESIDSSVLKNIVNRTDLSSQYLYWKTVCKILCKTDFSNDSQYEQLRPTLTKLLEAANSFVASGKYLHTIHLSGKIPMRDEILKIILPFIIIDNKEVADDVHKWIIEQEKQLNDGDSSGQEKKTVSEDMMISIANHISDDSFEKLLLNILHEPDSCFEIKLCYILKSIIKNHEKAADFIVKNFPEGKVIHQRLAECIANYVSDFPAFMKKIDPKELSVLKSVFTKIKDNKKRKSQFLCEILDRIVQSLRCNKWEDMKKLEDVKKIACEFPIYIEDIVDACVADGISITIPLAKFLDGIDCYNHHWLFSVKDLWESEKNVIDFIGSTKHVSAVIDGIGKIWAEKYGYISMDLALCLAKAKPYSCEWIKSIDDLFKPEVAEQNIKEFLKAVVDDHDYIFGYKSKAASEIGKIYAEKNKHISMDLALCLAKAGPYNYGWIKAVDELFKPEISEQNIEKLLSSAKFKKQLACEIEKIRAGKK